MNEHQQLAMRVADIRRRMNAACLSVGRPPESVLLCAASKTRDVRTVQQAQGTGIDLFGENRVQELVEKHAANAYGATPLHFIGHLQTNKVRQVVGIADLIESVDSLRLLQAIEKEAARQNLTQCVLIEVNIAQEESKSGISPNELFPLLFIADTLEHVQVNGLMCVPPRCENTAEQRHWFSLMQDLFNKASSHHWQKVQMETLSMGMSGDFEAAIVQGATIIRVGTAIFGPRFYPTPSL